MSPGTQRPTIAFVSREVAPFSGGGIGPIVTAAATLLSEVAEVTVVTDAAYRAEYERLLAAGDPRIPPASVRFVFVEHPDPQAIGAFPSVLHAWGARVWDALRDAYPERGPSLVEFGDYLAEGQITIQAKRTGDPWFATTRVAVRLHTSSHMCQVLNGHVGDEFETIALHEAERYCLIHADLLLWSGGDVFETYRRFYAGERLAPAVCIPDAFSADLIGDHDAGDPGVDAAGGPLKLLYLGRMERRKGVLELLRAMAMLPGDVDCTLSLLGGDTSTGPLLLSMRDQLELMAAGDDRISFLEAVPRHEVPGIIRAHHVVVSPSIWECWPNVVRESLAGNRPVIATPVGGQVALVRPGESGWLTDGPGARALARTIEQVARDREEVAELVGEQRPRSVLRRFTDPDELRTGYLELLAAPPARRRPAAHAAPLVSVVVPYFRLHDLVGETLESVGRQTHASIETIVVNDGSFAPEDEILLSLGERYGVEVVHQRNTGLGGARNTGAALARGKYVLPLDADDLIEPTFVERCVAALEADPTLAYVTTWAAFIDDDGVLEDDFGLGYMPQGNWSRLVDRRNVAGTCTALIRKSVFDRGLNYSPDLSSYEDWFFYREMRERGLLGDVIPDKLFLYRVRTGSMLRSIAIPREQVLLGEMRALERRREMQWSAAV